MSFSFGFFEESEANVADIPASVRHVDNAHWMTQIENEVKELSPNSFNQLRFIGRDEHIANERAFQSAESLPYGARSTIPLSEDFSIDIIHLEKEIKVGETVTDLIPGQYEGGYKLWECSVDLAEYLVKNQSDLVHQFQSDHRPLRILELGCGIGLPGIAAQRLFPDISELWMSDFNDTVLLETTWPSLMICPLELAFRQSQISQLPRYSVAGDWLTFSAWLTAQNAPPFDLILSAETLYSPIHCQKVAYFLSKHLTPNTGQAVFSNKRFYFGVGGGSTYFADLMNELNNQDGLSNVHWSIETVQSVTDGQSNIRDIQAIRCQHAST